MIKIDKNPRNKPCFCGSGKKYKKCHGSRINQTSFSSCTQEEINTKVKELEAIQKQREQQQGLGNPIISALYKNCRFVAVGSQVYWSQNWETFSDFLGDYIKFVFGREWWEAEIQNPLENRHPILQWGDILYKHQEKYIKQKGEIYSAPMIGAIDAYYNLSYNLYLLAHNAQIQSKLITRLKHKDHFDGALYETYVAAAFIKAGFDLEFENEDDVTISHCEFTATCKKTKNKYSVEAKSREPNSNPARINRQLTKALKKNATHSRVVFINVNVPDNVDDTESISWLKEALQSIRTQEGSMMIDELPAPAAYIFVTNHPSRYNLETVDYRRSVLAEGFKIPDFKIDSQFSSIRDAINAREKHADMEQLMESIRTHYEIPTTFDGEIPEFAFDKSLQKLKIGHKYLIPIQDGQEIIGELTATSVFEEEKLVHCAYSLENGSSIIVKEQLSDEELLVYKKYPDTFFGVYQPVGKRTDDPLAMFDFVYNSYRQNSKERLLELMKSHYDYENLKNKSQEELLKEYAIRCCESIVASSMG